MVSTRSSSRLKASRTKTITKSPKRQPETTRKSSRRKKTKPPTLVLKSYAKTSSKKKVAEVMLAMTAPHSSNSNTSGAIIVKNQVGDLNGKYNGKDGEKKYTFIIGHLVNEQFGCQPGDENFVPLTSQANAAHKNEIEAPLVKFLTSMNGPTGDSFNRAVDDKNELFFAVCYHVESSSSFWGRTYPDSCVPNSITWKLTFHVVRKNGSIVSRLDNDIKTKFKEFKTKAETYFRQLSGTIKNVK